MTEAVHLEVGQAGHFDVTVDDAAHLAVAYRGRVLVDAFPPAGEAPLAGPIKRRQIGLYDAEDRIVAN